MAITWNNLVNPNRKPADSVKHRPMSTCDEYCKDNMHSPGCALRTLVTINGYKISKAIKGIEEAIELDVTKSDKSQYHPYTRKYDADNATEEETKRYKHLMTLLQEAVYGYCDCGAKHDKGGHYHWCSTQK